MRYGSQKRRATTSKTYAMDSTYEKCLKDAKRIHRTDEEFYIYIIGEHYSSISLMDFNTNENYKKESTLEHWVFDNKKWIRRG